MKNKRNMCFIIAGAALFLLNIPMGAQAVGTISHQPPGGFTPGQVLVLHASVSQPPEWLTVFWRAEGMDDFLAQPFAPGENGVWDAFVDTSKAGNGNIEYYLACKAGGQIGFLPPVIPDTLFRLRASAPVAGQVPIAPAPVPMAGSMRGQPFPFNLDASFENRFNDSAGVGTSNPAHTENLRLNYQMRLNQINLQLQIRASYTNLQVPGQAAFDLPDMRVFVSAPAHSLRVGDIAPAESEFTIAGMGRRGAEYIYDDHVFYAHLFSGGTQQMLGFKGFGIPSAAAAVYGAAAGMTLFQSFSLKTVYLIGQDDPALSGNIGLAPYYNHPRKGNVLSIIGQSVLFQQHLTLTAEYARSKYDYDTTDTSDEASGDALRVNGALQLGRFDLRAGYKDISADFNSIAQSFFMNDRKGYDVAAGVTLATLRLSGAVAIEKTNTADDPARVAASDFRRQVDLTWQFIPSSSLRLGYSFSRQDARLNNNPVLQGNLDREGIAGGISLAISPALRIGVDVRKDDLRSVDNPLIAGGSLGGNLSLFWQSPDRVMLNAMAGLSRTTNTASGAAATLYSGFFSGDVTLVARLLTLNAIGSYFRYELSGPGQSEAINANGGVCVHLQKLLASGDIILSLRGGYLSNTNAGTTTHDERFFLRCDVSL
jgi:hypothetical protein